MGDLVWYMGGVQRMEGLSADYQSKRGGGRLGLGAGPIGFSGANNPAFAANCEADGRKTGKRKKRKENSRPKVFFFREAGRIGPCL